MVMGYDLLSTLALQSEYVSVYRALEPVACPRCGEPLRLGPPSSPAVLYCNWGHFQYPRDWDPDTMSGM